MYDLAVVQTNLAVVRFFTIKNKIYRKYILFKVYNLKIYTFIYTFLKIYILFKKAFLC